MLITISNRRLLQLFGWKQERLPRTVTASWRLWWFWLRH